MLDVYEVNKTYSGLSERPQLPDAMLNTVQSSLLMWVRWITTAAIQEGPWLVAC